MCDSANVAGVCHAQLSQDCSLSRLTSGFLERRCFPASHFLLGIHGLRPVAITDQTDCAGDSASQWRRRCGASMWKMLLTLEFEDVTRSCSGQVARREPFQPSEKYQSAAQEPMYLCTATRTAVLRRRWLWSSLIKSTTSHRLFPGNRARPLSHGL